MTNQDAATMPASGLHSSYLASLTPKQRKRLLSSLTEEQNDQILHDWRFWATTAQINPPGKWQYWLFLAGRGAGKTRAGAEWTREKVKEGYKYIALIAPTTSDVRKVMVEGPSGILATGWEHDVDNAGNKMGRPEYSPANRKITWANGAYATTFSAEEPDRLRGPQHDAIWADELAAWQYATDTWDMAMFGLRVGQDPRVMISTTPRPIPIIRELVKMDPLICAITHSTTYQNRANLAPSFFDTIIQKYEGTRLGRQELRGEILEEAEGALWSRDLIEHALKPQTSEYRRVIVSVDPSISDKASSALCGIVVAALGVDDRCYILEDASGRMSPDAWSRVVFRMYDKYKADRIIAEGNQGGELVRHTLNTVQPNTPISIVHASRSKQARAEPVAALYEQGKVTHIKPFPELEDQMCTWEPLGGDPSPDRLDALVWACYELMLKVRAPPIVMPFVAGTPRVIPGQ